jgi:hypothetical protein
MLRNNVLRAFRIEVATDSMVYQDEQQEKQDRMEFLQACSMFMEKAVQAGQFAPPLIPLAVELLKFGVTGFRVGKAMEGTIDEAADQLRQQAAQQMANPQPNPEMVKAQAAQQQTQLQEQNKAQMQQMQLQHDAALKQLDLQHDEKVEALKAQAQQAGEAAKLQYQAQCDALQRQHEAAMKQMEDNFNRWKTQYDNDTKVLVAQIAAETSIKTTAMSASDEDTEVSPDGTRKPSSALQGVVDAVNKQFEALVTGQQETSKQLIEAVTRPKKVLRGPDGKLTGVQ